MLLAISQTAAAQEAKPQEAKGVSVDSKDMLGLAQHFSELKGFALRIRKVTIEPGGVVPYHSHANRPTVAYLVSGELTEFRDDTPEITRRPGEHWVEGGDLKRWSTNRGQVPILLIAIDIVPEE